jgi:UDP-GlcNAc:undecaprenyl-phosphate GlcNAc-1-phosphate transferase
VQGLPIAVAALAGLLSTLVLIPWICRKSQEWKWTGCAREFHQTHHAPVPRFGGLAMAIACVVVAGVLSAFFGQHNGHEPLRWLIVASALAMFLLGFLDDIRPLGARKKLLGQILISLAVYFCGIAITQFKNPFTGEVIELGAWAVVVTVFWLVTVTNLINLIDGIDGLAGGVSFMLLLLLTYQAGATDGFPGLCAGMAASVLGFLFFNFPPARVHMGDGGAYFLGFLIGVLSLTNSQKGTVAAALIAPLFVLALPILDVCLAILRRGLRGLPIFRPDRRHIHHRLVEVGFSRAQSVLILYGIILVGLVIGFVVFLSQGRLTALLFGITCLAFLVIARCFKFSRGWFAVGRVLGNSLEMRKEVQYALTLTKWLEQEGERCESLEELWKDFSFAARKSGFAEIRLVLEDGERVWHVDRPVGREENYSCRQDLHVGANTVMEFSAPRAAMSRQLFELLCELLAEGWIKALQKCRAQTEARSNAGGTAERDGRVLAGGPVYAETAKAAEVTR